jgi:glycoprotein 3-alpha-L-fucosyltransferase
MLLASLLSWVTTVGSQCAQRPHRNYSAHPVTVLSPDYGPSQFRRLWDCAVPCVLSGDLATWPRADAWLERLPAKKRSQPSRRPAKACPLQQFVLLSQESEAYYPLLKRGEARAKGFDIVASTHPASDVPLSYASGKRYDFLEPPLPFANKTKAAAAFVSNCGAKNGRLELVAAIIAAGFKVHSFGTCLHNAEAGDTRAAKVQQLRKHLFSLSFENSNVPGYVTEKYFQALAAGTVPVYLGAPDVARYSPTAILGDSVVAVPPDKSGDRAGASVAARAGALAKELAGLARDQQAYDRLLAWKRRPGGLKGTPLGELLEAETKGGGSTCRLCAKVKERVEAGLQAAPPHQAGGRRAPAAALSSLSSGPPADASTSGLVAAAVHGPRPAGGSLLAAAAAAAGASASASAASRPRAKARRKAREIKRGRE